MYYKVFVLLEFYRSFPFCNRYLVHGWINIILGMIRFNREHYVLESLEQTRASDRAVTAPSWCKRDILDHHVSCIKLFIVDELPTFAT